MSRSMITGWNRRIWLAIVLIAGFVAYATFLQVFVLAHYSGGIDIYPVWKAGRALFLSHLDPYSPQVTHAIQLGIYGKTASTNQEPYIFIYPLYFLFLVFPLLWLPFLWALAAWLAFLQIGYGVLSFLLLRHYQLGQRPFTRGLFFLWATLLFPTIAGFWLAQPSVLIFLLFCSAWLALYHHYDRLAGICLGLLIIKPQIVALPLILLLLYVLYQRRFNVIAAFAAVVCSLIAGSFLVFPSWVSSFLVNVHQYVRITGALFQDGPALQLLTALAGPLNTPLFVAAFVLIVLYMLWMWWQAIKMGWSSLERALVITMLAQATLFSAQHAPNQMLLLIPGFYLLAKLKGVRGYPFFLAFSVLSTILLPWLIRIFIPSQFAGSPWIIVPLPLMLALLLLVTMKQSEKKTSSENDPAQQQASLSFSLDQMP